jgi:hypothetical protein
MQTSARVAVLTLMLAVLALPIGPPPVSAHVRAREAAAATTPPVKIRVDVRRIAPPGPATPGVPAHAPLWPSAMLAAAVLLVVATPRRALAMALLLILAVFAAETAVHSVHHLTDQQPSRCVAASASAHVHGTALDPPAELLLCPPARAGAVVTIASAFPGSRSLRPDEGRAPPS